MLLEHFNRCAITLNTLVMRLVEAAGRDAFVRSCNLAGTAPKVRPTRAPATSTLGCPAMLSIPVQSVHCPC